MNEKAASLSLSSLLCLPRVCDAYAARIIIMVSFLPYLLARSPYRLLVVGHFIYVSLPIAAAARACMSPRSLGPGRKLTFTLRAFLLLRDREREGEGRRRHAQ